MKIGVYICDCGVNIAGVVDTSEVTKYAEGLEDVAVARQYKFMCSDPGQKLIKDDIKEYGLNRVVVASCSPSMHEPTFRAACQEAGLNPFLFEMANIREQCSWVHMHEAEKATEKAKDLVRMAVARARLLEPQERPKVKVKASALIIGGGIAGIQAALDLADQGFEVILVEKTPSIGGKMAQLDKTFPTNDCSACILTPKMVLVDRHPNIELLAYSEVKEVEGHIGNFKVKIEKKPKYVTNDCTACGLCTQTCPIEVPSEFEEGIGTRKAIYVPFPQAVPGVYTIDSENCIGCGMCKSVCEAEAIDYNIKPEIIEREVGTIIVATGYEIFNPNLKPEYSYDHPNVITSLQYERLMNASGPTGGKIVRLSDGKKPKVISFIQCVGSRDKNTNTYCSKVCCMYSMKQARLTKEKYPDTDIYIHYIDIRAPGKDFDEYYSYCRENGIKFIRGRVARVEQKGDNLVVKGDDADLGSPIEVEADLVVLAVGLMPCRDSSELSKMLKISRGATGWFQEAHPKLRPVDTIIDGVYIAGVCQGPKDIPDSVAQGSAAAARAAIPMAKGEVEVEPIIATVNEELCIGCRLCERVCDYEAIEILERKAIVNEAICKGCGSCAGACPTNAMEVRHFKDAQIIAMIEAALKEG